MAKKRGSESEEKIEDAMHASRHLQTCDTDETRTWVSYQAPGKGPGVWWFCLLPEEWVKLP